jgi:hypothetical protein
MNITTVITVNGTKKSEHSFGLDDGEISEFTIKPGQYDGNLSSVNDLIAQIEQSAYTRGEWISSLCIDGVDVVQQIISEKLVESCGNIKTTIQNLAEADMFCNAEANDLLSLVTQVAKPQRGEL